VDGKNEKMAEAWLTAWISKMWKLAEECANDTKHYRKAAENFHHTGKRESGDDGNHTMKQAVLSSPLCMANTHAQHLCSHPPKLTKNEHHLLDKHQGCTKCHKGYQNHHARNCPNEFPDAVGYTKLMDQMLLGHKCAQGVSSSTHPVGAVIDIVNDKPENNAAFTINAVMPSSVLDTGDTTDEEMCALLISPHFRWLCQLTGPESEFPTAVNSMIDIGVHGVFINPELIQKCNYHRLKLLKSLIIDLALQNGCNSQASLTEYIKICLLSSDSSWSSITIKAIIVPRLCVPLLLGVPFLEAITL